MNCQLIWFEYYLEKKSSLLNVIMIFIFIFILLLSDNSWICLSCGQNKTLEDIFLG